MPASLETEVLHEMEICNPGVSAEILITAFKADGTQFYYDYELKQEQLTDISPLASLPHIENIELRKTNVTDLSAFTGREKLLRVEKSKLPKKKEN